MPKISSPVNSTNVDSGKPRKPMLFLNNSSFYFSIGKITERTSPRRSPSQGESSRPPPGPWPEVANLATLRPITVLNRLIQTLSDGLRRPARAEADHIARSIHHVVQHHDAHALKERIQHGRAALGEACRAIHRPRHRPTSPPVLSLPRSPQVAVRGHRLHFQSQSRHCLGPQRWVLAPSIHIRPSRFRLVIPHKLGEAIFLASQHRRQGCACGRPCCEQRQDDHADRRPCWRSLHTLGGIKGFIKGFSQRG